MRALLTYGTYRLLGALIGRLPPRGGYWVAGWTGWLLYVLSPRLRRVLADNVRHVLGLDADESQVQALVRQTCVNITKGHYDLFRVGRLSGDEIEELVRVEGWESLEQALALGQGAIVFSAHLGNVDLVIQLPAVRGIRSLAPAEHVQPERLFQYTLRLRQSHGARLIPSDGPMMGLFRALKEGAVVGLAADRDTTSSGRVVDFFGSPTRLPDGAVRVALRTGSPLIPAFAQRLPDNSFFVQFEPPLELPQTGDEEADIATGMRMVAATLEQYISQHPEQWLVAQPIWPTR